MDIFLGISPTTGIPVIAENVISNSLHEALESHATYCVPGYTAREATDAEYEAYRNYWLAQEVLDFLGRL